MIRAVAIVASILWTVVSAQTPCYLCGGDPSATFLLPNATLIVPTELQVQGITQIQCAQLFQAAMTGLLNSTQCDIASSASEVSTTCGCSNAAVAPVVSPVTSPLPVAAPVAAPTSLPLSDLPSSIPSTLVSSIVPSSIPSDVITSPPFAVETSAPASDAPSDSPSSAPTVIVCPDGKSKKKKGGMMKGGMMKGGMMMGSEDGKGKKSKESKGGRRKTRAHGEPTDDEEPDDDDEEYEYVCPDSIPKGKDKASNKGMMGKGSSSVEDESEGKGMMALKDKTPPEEGKKEPKRLRFQL